jgi:MFS family permease
MAVNGLYVFLPLYLADVMGLSPLLIGATMTALQIGGLIGTPVAGTWSDRVGRRSVMIAGLTVTTVLLVALTVTGNAAVFVTGVSLLGFVLFSVRPVIQSWLMDLTPPRLAGSATSLLFGVQSALSALAPAVGGIVADHWGLTPVFALLAGTILIANLLVFTLPRAAPKKGGG